MAAGKAVAKSALRALLYGVIALVVNGILLLMISGVEWTEIAGGANAGSLRKTLGTSLVAAMFLIGFPLGFGWLGWMQGLADSARELVARKAPDLSRLVFSKLEARLDGSTLESRFDAAGGGAKSLLDRLRAGVPWLRELPSPVRRVVSLARRVSDPIDQVANVLGTFGKREVSAREVLGRAEGEFAQRLAGFVPGVTVPP